MTHEQLDAGAEVLGFLSALVLWFQTWRLIRHQHTVKGLVESAKRRKGTRLGELARTGADKLNGLLGQWDRRDEQLLYAGLAGLAGSFALKLWAMWLT